MKLYAFALSPFSAKVRIALAEKGLDCDIVDIPTSRAGIVSKPAELLAINPRGQVPVLVDGELGLYDSTVILEYLEDRFPATPLYPRDVAMRARCRQLEDAGDDATAGPMVALVAEIWRKSDPATRDAAKIADARASVVALAERLERSLKGGEYVCGDFSVADISCFIPLTMCGLLGAPTPDSLTAVKAWQVRMAARPSVARDTELMMKDAARLGGAPPQRS
jgi:glutathione S-transferase